MASPSIAWPHKTRELQNVIFDSVRWNGFKFRDDDIVIATWAKSGTTWMQQIVGQLVFRGAEGLPIEQLSPWLDFRPAPIEHVLSGLEAQTNRRFIKTHLPLDALVFSPTAKYLYVGRDGRDVIWSWYNHHSSFTPQAYEMFNSIPGRVGPPLEPPSCGVVEYFRRWMDGEEMSLSDFWSHYQGWWDARNLPNVMLVHYNNLKA